MRTLSRRAMLAAPALAAAPSTLSLGRKVRLGIIGTYGHLGEVTQPLPQLPDVEVVAVATGDAPELKRVMKNPRLAGARAYSDWRQLLDREKIDMAAICTSNMERVEPVVACTERGIHWIAEKPLAGDRAGLAKIEQACARNPKVKFSILLPMRFDPAYLALKKIVDSGAIGEVANITSQKSYKAGDRPEWMKNRRTYGSTILWIGIHMIDLMRWASGREMTEVFSWQAQVQAPAGIGAMENTTASVFRLDNGGVATLHMDYYRPESSPSHGDDRLRLAGTKGVAEYMAATGVTLLREGAKPEVVRELPEERQVFLDFLGAVYLNRTPSLTPRDVFQVNRITIAAHEAAETRALVKV